jgi:3-oxoacyl-[acyl-carrier-protein] synthase II
MDRIVITGMGVISPAGTGVEALHSALLKGSSFIRHIDSFDTSDLPSKIGAEVKEFEARDFLNTKNAKSLDRSTQFFISACILAIEDSSLFKGTLDRTRVGIFEGTSLGGISKALQEHEVLLSRGYHYVNPQTIHSAMTGASGDLVSLLYRLQGPILAFSNGSVSSACALSSAIDKLHVDEIDFALVGGSEAPINRPIFTLFNRAKILSTRNATPESACRPFDAERDGIVLGEGGAVIVLERLTRAQKRGAKIYAEICSVSLTGDACNLVAPAPDGLQQARAMQQVMEKGRVTSKEIDYISAHGTATFLNDRIETLAVKRAFRDFAYKIPLSSSKPILGHPLGASTAMELVKTIIAMKYQFLPPTINLFAKDPECDLDYVPNFSREAQIKVALVNNSSFGGRNSSVLLRKLVE